MPLLTTPIVLRQIATVLFVSFCFVTLIVGVIFGLESDGAGFLKTLRVLVVIYLGLAMALCLVMALYFGNHITMVFTLDSKGVRSEVRDYRARRASKLAVLLGMAAGNFSVMGAGRLAQSGASSFVAWHRVKHVHFDDARNTIYLHNAWLTLAAIFCTADSYLAAKVFITVQTQ